MLLTGYHGTSQYLAHSIIETGQYHISSGPKEWLGNGIYFYEKFSDAYLWRSTNGGRNTVLHSVVEIGEDEYLDIDSPEGTEVWNSILNYICTSRSITLIGNAQENQNAVNPQVVGSSPTGGAKKPPFSSRKRWFF